MSTWLSEDVALIGTIDPQTVVNTEKFTDVIDTSEFHQFMFVFALGDMAAETIDAKVYYCDSSGSNATAFKSATQLAAHATNNDNDQIVICVNADELAGMTYQYLKGGLVTGDAVGGAACCMVFGAQPRYGPASDYDLATVVEIETDQD